MGKNKHSDALIALFGGGATKVVDDTCGHCEGYGVLSRDGRNGVEVATCPKCKGSGHA